MVVGWFRNLVPVCHADLTGRRNPVADLGSGGPGNPGTGAPCCQQEFQFASGALR